MIDLSLWGILVSEIIGTFFLILLGCGVNANVNLKKTYGSSSGWIVISAGWAMAVMVGATAAFYSGGFLNPAVALAMWVEQSITFVEFIIYVLGELIGAFLGALIVIVMYWNHFKETQDQGAIAGTFYTSPAIKSPTRNLLTEILATSALVVSLLAVGEWSESAYLFGPLFAGLVVFGIGLTLGGLTGYSINPARDMMPRIAHTVVKIPNKKASSDWSYSWIPSVGPLMGGLLAVGFFEAVLAF